jgi:hypothetical protein
VSHADVTRVLAESGIACRGCDEEPVDHAKLKRWLQEMAKQGLMPPVDFPKVTHSQRSQDDLANEMRLKGPERVQSAAELALLLYKHGWPEEEVLPTCHKCGRRVTVPWKGHDKVYCSMTCRFPLCTDGCGQARPPHDCRLPGCAGDCGTKDPPHHKYLFHNWEGADKDPWTA